METERVSCVAYIHNTTHWLGLMSAHDYSAGFNARSPGFHIIINCTKMVKIIGWTEGVESLILTVI